MNTSNMATKFNNIVNNITNIGYQWHQDMLIDNSKYNVQYIENTIRELPKLQNEKQKSAIIVSAGPSLHNLDIISRIKKAGYKEDYFVGTRKKGKVLKIINGYCVFLSVNGGKSKCKIYSHRPNVCRRFPNVKIFSMKSYDPRCDAFKLPKFLP